jgi:hypothetical protein
VAVAVAVTVALALAVAVAEMAAKLVRAGCICGSDGRVNLSGM